MVLSALTCEEIRDPTNMSKLRLCVDDEALGLPLDIDCFPDWSEERVYEPLVFVLSRVVKKPFAKKEAFREGQVAISGQGDVVLKSTS